MNGRNRETSNDNRRAEDRFRRLESLRASEIPVDAIDGLDATDVQAALAALAGAGVALAASSSYIDDTAAAAGGVAIGGYYRNGSVVQVRVT